MTNIIFVTISRVGMSLAIIFTIKRITCCCNWGCCWSGCWGCCWSGGWSCGRSCCWSGCGGCGWSCCLSCCWSGGWSSGWSCSRSCGWNCCWCCCWRLKRLFYLVVKVIYYEKDTNFCEISTLLFRECAPADFEAQCSLL